MPEPLIRPATESDVPAIAIIYNHYVLHSTSTFETEPPGIPELNRRRIETQSCGFPYLIAEKESAVAGYAYASPYRTRPAYRFSVEDSIYIHPYFARRGLGRLLLAELIERCAARGSRQMIAVIGDRANTASIRLHTGFGFRNVGYLEAVGRKFDRWIDTVLMQRALSTGEHRSTSE